MFFILERFFYMSKWHRLKPESSTFPLWCLIPFTCWGLFWGDSE